MNDPFKNTEINNNDKLIPIVTATFWSEKVTFFDKEDFLLQLFFQEMTL